MEVDHAVAEAALVQELQPQADVVGEGPVAPADHDRREEQVDSSTSPAFSASAARPGPPTLRSAPAAAFSCRTASGSKSRSIRVLALETASSVRE